MKVRLFSSAKVVGFYRLRSASGSIFMGISGVTQQSTCSPSRLIVIVLIYKNYKRCLQYPALHLLDTNSPSIKKLIYCPVINSFQMCTVSIYIRITDQTSLVESWFLILYLGAKPFSGIQSPVCRFITCIVIS